METSTKTFEQCPSCNTKLASGFLSTVAILPQNHTAIINEFSESKKEYYCTKCGSTALENTKRAANKEIEQISQQLQNRINDVTIVSIQSPNKWDYDVLEIVTGQSTTGTGVFSEFSSSITDFFGGQSGAFNNKIKNGEQLCQAQLRMKCLELGGNAVVAADIDYAEVGGDKGMLLVCMTGTAVKLKNTEVLGTGKTEKLIELSKLTERKLYLSNLLIF